MLNGDLVMASDSATVVMPKKQLGMIIGTLKANATHVNSEHMKNLESLRETMYYILFAEGIVGPAYEWELTSLCDSSTA